jgi:hypothetical protein
VAERNDVILEINGNIEGKILLGDHSKGFYSDGSTRKWSIPAGRRRTSRIDSNGFPKTIPTLMFNGYSDKVASLYNRIA